MNNTQFHTSYTNCVINPLVRVFPKQLQAHKPFFLGICGAAASGKTTLSKILAQELIQTYPTKKIIAHSLDDFHFSKKERNERNIVWRGAPGAHNFEEMKKLLNLKSGPFPFSLPKFNKSTDDYDVPLKINGQPDIFIIEGLLVGMNDHTYPYYYEYISQHLDLLIFIEAPLNKLKSWRLAAERERKKETGHAMDEDELSRYWDEQLEPMIATHILPIQKIAQVIVKVNEDRIYSIKWR